MDTQNIDPQKTLEDLLASIDTLEGILVSPIDKTAPLTPPTLWAPKALPGWLEIPCFEKVDGYYQRSSYYICDTCGFGRHSRGYAQDQPYCPVCGVSKFLDPIPQAATTTFVTDPIPEPIPEPIPDSTEASLSDSDRQALTRTVAADILKELGLTLDEAINIFLHAVVTHRGIPFVMTTNDAVIQAGINASLNYVAQEIN